MLLRAGFHLAIAVTATCLVQGCATCSPPAQPLPEDWPRGQSRVVHHLEVDESAKVRIAAESRWNPTGIQMVPGEEYAVATQGQWCDATTRHSPDGERSESFYMRLWEPFRRGKDADWFTLMCGINSDESTTFKIDVRKPIAPLALGELTCFANDVAFFYFNNTGEIGMTVTRTR